MTDAEIIKALECCQTDHCHGSKCPLFNGTVNTKDCITKLSAESLDLINRQKAEIEDLTARLNATIAGQKTLQKALAEKNAKIEALQMDNAQLQSDNANANMNCEHLQAEIERFKKIETAVNGFWDEIPKLAMVKNKKYPTLEELLEYIENLKNEAIKECLEKVKTYCYENVWFENNFEESKLYQFIDNLVEEKAGDAE